MLMYEVPELHLDGKVAEARFRKVDKPKMKLIKQCIFCKDIECDLGNTDLEICKNCPLAIFLHHLPRRTINVVMGLLSFIGAFFIQGFSYIQQIIVQIAEILPW